MLVFIDESGDHDLRLGNIDPNYEVFVLGAVIISEEEHQIFDVRLKELKKKFFGGENFILHTRELSRPFDRKSDPRNQVLVNKDTRRKFYEELTTIIASTNFQAIFAVINKIAHCATYTEPLDPYDLSFENVLNRILHYTQGGNIKIYPEKRNNSKLDRHLEFDFQKYSEIGITFHKAESIRSRVTEFKLKDKKSNISGLQLIDLLVTPVGRHFIGKSPKPVGNEVPYVLVQSKLAGPQALTRIS